MISLKSQILKIEKKTTIESGGAKTCDETIFRIIFFHKPFELTTKLSSLIKTVIFFISVTLHLCRAKEDFYSKLSRKTGRCETYNGEMCQEFLKGKSVYLAGNKTIALLDKKLKKWFKQTREASIINTECWEHAKAYTCLTSYPVCGANLKLSQKKPLCSSHCDFLESHVCASEFKRARHSDFYQQFLPLCEKVALVDDSDGENCFFLPTVDFNKGPILFAEPHKQLHKQLGKMAILKCKFGIRNFVWTKENSMMVTEGTWYRDDRRIVGNERLQMRTKQKGSSRLFMMLKINNLGERDNGRYRCVIRFGNVTVAGSAGLTVYRSKVLPFVIPPSTKSPKQFSNEAKKGGKCVMYERGVCENYVNRNGHAVSVFEETKNPIELLNRHIEMVISGLLTTKDVSKRCEDFGRPVICLHKFNQCHNKTKQPVPSLCKEDCELFQFVYCKKELRMILQEFGLHNLYFPDCDALPVSNPYCLPIKRMTYPVMSTDSSSLMKNQVHNMIIPGIQCYNEDSSQNYLGTVATTESGLACDRWHSYPLYANISHNYCRNFGESRPWCFIRNNKNYCSVKACTNWLNPACYTNNGAEYYGTVNKGKSGRKCLPWNIARLSYSNVEHSYCRNYGNEMNSPWCYVDLDTKEACDIAQCVPRGSEKYSAVIYIIPGVVAMSVIMFLLIIALLYFRNKKTVGENKSMISLEVDPNISTLSSTTSFAEEKTAMLDGRAPIVHTCKKRKANSGESQKRSKLQTVAEVKEGSLCKVEKLGDGRLGQLWKGKYTVERNVVVPVLIKKLTPETRLSVITEFRKEMNVLRHLKHAHLQPIVCVSAMSEIPFIAFEYRSQTDLKEFLKLNRRSLSPQFLASVANQLTSSVEFLHFNQIVHKDLAARNCFISTDGVVELSNAGLGMYRYPEDYVYLSGMGLSPVRWLAPETVETGVYNSVTDTYTFGVLLWEIFSCGQIPYDDLTDEHLVAVRLNGRRTLQRPANCPNEFWVSMTKCWTDPANRPTILQLKALLC